jgi:pyridoxal 5'-phosphate synthase pdxT subunit
VSLFSLDRRRDAILSPDLRPRGDVEGDSARIGVLALQGDFREHRAALARLGAATREVRHVDDLTELDGLVIPGGESTTIGKLMREYGFVAAIKRFAAAGGPVFGSCAGLIVMARSIVEGDQALLGIIDIVARRNAFGRQIHSFEADLDVPALGPRPMKGVFIRAPWIEDAGPGVTVLAEHGGHGVAAEEGRVMVTAFHPELTDDTRVHARFLELADDYRRERDGGRQRGMAGVASEEVVS